MKSFYMPITPVVHSTASPVSSLNLLRFPSLVSYACRSVSGSVMACACACGIHTCMIVRRQPVVELAGDAGSARAVSDLACHGTSPSVHDANVRHRRSSFPVRTRSSPDLMCKAVRTSGLQGVLVLMHTGLHREAKVRALRAKRVDLRYGQARFPATVNAYPTDDMTMHACEPPRVSG